MNKMVFQVIQNDCMCAFKTKPTEEMCLGWFRAHRMHAGVIKLSFAAVQWSIYHLYLFSGLIKISYKKWSKGNIFFRMALLYIEHDFHAFPRSCKFESFFSLIESKPMRNKWSQFFFVSLWNRYCIWPCVAISENATNIDFIYLKKSIRSR